MVKKLASGLKHDHAIALMLARRMKKDARSDLFQKHYGEQPSNAREKKKMLYELHDKNLLNPPSGEGWLDKILKGR